MSLAIFRRLFIYIEFLIYRVELKQLPWERYDEIFIASFLIYRVELKRTLLHRRTPEALPFLIYRVELKQTTPPPYATARHLVPNLPCGVETKKERARDEKGRFGS